MRVTRILDAFLLNDEAELLELRLNYLADVVDRFVIVTSSQTFSGLQKPILSLDAVPAASKLADRIDWIHLDRLEGEDAWQRETFSRNAVARGLSGCGPDDLVLVSDIDEIPRKSVLSKLRSGEFGRGPLVLELDYFNFKFNYRQVQGRHAVWPGSTACRFADFQTAQELRAERWRMLDAPGQAVEDGGWHFSYLTRSDDVSGKLKGFSHQEQEIQARGAASVNDQIARREGFHDHIHAGSVWAVVGVDAYRCDSMAALTARYPELMTPARPDSAHSIDARIRKSIGRLYTTERGKVLADYSRREIASELVNRMAQGIGFKGRQC